MWQQVDAAPSFERSGKPRLRDHAIFDTAKYLKNPFVSIKCKICKGMIIYSKVLEKKNSDSSTDLGIFLLCC